MRERFFDQDGKLIHHRVMDVEPALDRVKAIKDAGVRGFSENRFVGSIPLFIVDRWLKEAGVKWDDHEGMREVVDRKLQSGEFSKFRVWEGRY